MDIKVKAVKGHQGELTVNSRTYPCALGKSGVTTDKTEGDHAAPIGVYPLRSVYYRADKMQPPICALPCISIKPTDGWCDDPTDDAYNRPVTLPYPASHECLLRDDDLYDVVVVIGHNDAPPVPGRGSCIFMHVAKDGYEGTEGCVALKKPDLLEILTLINTESQIEILG